MSGESVHTSEVLIVEDDDDVRRLVQVVLEREGIHSDAVSGGYSALAAARSEAPRLVLLDVHMPDLDGLEVCRLLKADSSTSAPTVLMISSATTREDVCAGYAAGADDYLAKPFTPSELVQRVTRLLPHHPN